MLDNLSGFFKVAQTGGSFVVATFYNPDTNEIKTGCVRDYDYSDGSHDNDELYYMPVNEDIARKYHHFLGRILVGDTVKVIKGRKLPVGTIGVVDRFWDYKDRYGRTQTRYIVFSDGTKTNIDNCELIKGV